MYKFDGKIHLAVNCRIGSLEKKRLIKRLTLLVNCRIGSLENFLPSMLENSQVNCRIGSLENNCHIKHPTN